MIKIIDCDVHPYVQSVKGLYNYMDPAVVKKFEIAGVEISTGLDTILTRNPSGGTIRKDAKSRVRQTCRKLS
jgi:hypothetical protein